MRYHFDKPEIYLSLYGERYICEHPVYNKRMHHFSVYCRSKDFQLCVRAFY